MFTIFLKRKSKSVVSTPFSEFIRNASSAEKKRVYKHVLEKASENRSRVLARAASAKWRATGRRCLGY